MYQFPASNCSRLHVSLLSAAFMLATAGSAAAVEIAPYEARVIVAGASVHSGPGENFYPTDTLALGDLVEVYQEKPGGWLGIRPTVNSFSWVSSRDLNPREGGLGEILNDNVASRIGSRLSDKHNAAQVRLKKGEVVEVLGEENFAGETWYKIAPPAGEFRWVQSSIVEKIGPLKSRNADAPLASSAAADSKALTAATPEAKAVTSEPPAASSGAEAPPLIDAKSNNGDGWTKSGGANAPSPVPANATPNPPSVSPPATASAPADAAADSARRLPPTAIAPTSPAPVTLNEELAAIELRLSRMASAPINLWNTERLERDAAQLMNRAQTPAEREAVQATMAKISRFASITHKTNTPGATALAQQTGQPPITPLPGSPAMAANGQYDAVGILRPVVSRRPGAPQFALVDDHGQVLSFVTPSPDVNLQPYLGRRVGVVGNRSFIAEFNRSHVTAARVTPMVR